MKPVDQSIFVNDPRGIPGDCLRAAVASLYELPLEAVPHFALYDRWMDALNAWLKPRVAFARIVHNDRGYEGTCWPGQPLLAFGMSPRGVEHAAVWLDGVVAHDPHPSRGGFVGAPYELWDVLPAPQPADKEQSRGRSAKKRSAGFGTTTARSTPPRYCSHSMRGRHSRLRTLPTITSAGHIQPSRLLPSGCGPEYR